MMQGNSDGLSLVIGKIWDGMGYGGPIPYYGMVWDLT